MQINQRSCVCVCVHRVLKCRSAKNNFSNEMCVWGMMCVFVCADEDTVISREQNLALQKFSHDASHRPNVH